MSESLSNGQRFCPSFAVPDPVADVLAGKMIDPAHMPVSGVRAGPGAAGITGCTHLRKKGICPEIKTGFRATDPSA
jgi:hypothetical protein